MTLFAKIMRYIVYHGAVYINTVPLRVLQRSERAYEQGAVKSNTATAQEQPTRPQYTKLFLQMPVIRNLDNSKPSSYYSPSGTRNIITYD
jgi:hypothetical protein